MWHGLQDLSFLTRDGIQAATVKAPSPNHWTTREFPHLGSEARNRGVLFGMNSNSTRGSVGFKSQAEATS